MHDDLKEVIKTARATRDKLLNRTLMVDEANAVFNQNRAILTAHGLDLRERVLAVALDADEPALAKRRPRVRAVE